MMFSPSFSCYIPFLNVSVYFLISISFDNLSSHISIPIAHLSDSYSFCVIMKMRKWFFFVVVVALNFMHKMSVGDDVNIINLKSLKNPSGKWLRKSWWIDWESELVVRHFMVDLKSCQHNLRPVSRAYTGETSLSPETPSQAIATKLYPTPLHANLGTRYKLF